VAGLDPADEIAALTSKLASIEAVLDPAAMQTELEGLREQAADPELWADPDRAQKVGRRLSYLEAELTRLAEIVSEKANRAVGPMAVVFPAKGFSALDREGFSYYEPETDRVFLESLKRGLKSGIEVIEVNAHVFEENFLAEVAMVYDKISKRR